VPNSWECRICPNYAFCSVFRGEEVMQSNPCPYEVANGKVENTHTKVTRSFELNSQTPLT